MNTLTNGCLIRRFEALGTCNEIRVYQCFQADTAAVEKALNDAVRRVNKIDDRMSVFKTDSDIARLNRNAGVKPVHLHPDTLKLLQTAVTFGEKSGGAFDCTIRPLIQLWGIGKKPNFIPKEQDISRTQQLVNYRDLMINPKKNTAFLKKPGQAVDLGGIAKGYAADEVKRILLEGGVSGALINLGGNIHTIGSNPDNQPWNIGIQNPTAETGDFLGIVSVIDKTIVTSGSNERFFMQNGIRYHHLLDPRTGEPAQSGLLSVTVVMKSSTKADALTTALFVLGIEKGMQLLYKIRADAIFVTESCQVYATQGIQKNFVMSH